MSSDEMWEMCTRVIGGYWPDVIVYYDVSLETIEVRKGIRSEQMDRIDQKSADYFTGVKEKYDELSQRDYSLCGGLWINIDANNGIEEVHQQTVDVLSAIGILGRK